MTPPGQLSDRALRELLLQTFLEVQQAEQARGTLPPDRYTLTARLSSVFEYSAAIVLGLLIASGCTMAVFIVTRVLLHVDFSRYAWL